jgi:DNA-binding CsgD family transcriptional regulator
MGRRRIARWKTPAGWKAVDGCTILDCGRAGIARGMCWNHYQRARRGLPVYVFLKNTDKRNTAVMFGPEKKSRSFLRLNRLRWELGENVSWEPTTGCALWLGEVTPLKSPSGKQLEYGYLGGPHDPWGRYAHRAVLWFAGVDLKKGSRKLHVRHLCDQPACVNPAHLRYGTAKENVEDRERRYEREGRRPHNATKLTPRVLAYVREAVAAGASYSELGRDLGINQSTIWRAINGRRLNNQQAAQAA